MLTFRLSKGLWGHGKAKQAGFRGADGRLLREGGPYAKCERNEWPPREGSSGQPSRHPLQRHSHV